VEREYAVRGTEDRQQHPKCRTASRLLYALDSAVSFKALLASFHDTSPSPSSSNCFPIRPDPPSDEPAHTVPFLTSPLAAHTCVTHRPSPSTRCLPRKPPSPQLCQRPCIPSKPAGNEHTPGTVVPHDRASNARRRIGTRPAARFRGETCRSASSEKPTTVTVRVLVYRVHGSPCEGGKNA